MDKFHVFATLEYIISAEDADSAMENAQEYLNSTVGRHVTDVTVEAVVMVEEKDNE